MKLTSSGEGSFDFAEKELICHYSSGPAWAFVYLPTCLPTVECSAFRNTRTEAESSWERKKKVLSSFKTESVWATSFFFLLLLLPPRNHEVKVRATFHSTCFLYVFCVVVAALLLLLLLLLLLSCCDDDSVRLAKVLIQEPRNLSS